MVVELEKHTRRRTRDEGRREGREGKSETKDSKDRDRDIYFLNLFLSFSLEIYGKGFFSFLTDFRPLTDFPTPSYLFG